MQKFLIQGNIPLKGKVKLSGAKNATLPIMAASLLIRGKCYLDNVPKLTDIEMMGEVLRELGANLIRQDNRLTIDTSFIQKEEISCELAKKLRASVLVLGPLLARNKRAKVPLPGGCNIGSRPVNLHLKGLRSMGANIEVKKGYIEATVNSGLTGSSIYLDFPSVGATENIMLAASIAKGTTIIKNASRSPEIVDLSNFLKKGGVKIKGAGTDTIIITGNKEIVPITHSIIPDRIEAGTFMIAAAITGGEILITNAKPEHLGVLISKLKQIGVEVKLDKDKIMVKGSFPLKSFNVTTLPDPGFPTDLQPQITSLACLADGESVISETIFENRFTHIPELEKMGAKITRRGKTTIVKGVPFLHGSCVVAYDIRGGASLVLAGLAARGTTEILNIHHIDRGYQKIEEKLILLGAKIKRVED